MFSLFCLCFFRFVFRFDHFVLPRRRIRPLGVVATGLKWAIPSVLATVLLDSALWGR